jgi:hypothetical protein
MRRHPPWLVVRVLGGGAIPSHRFVSPANRLRCTRAGGVREHDDGVVGELLAR